MPKYSRSGSDRSALRTLIILYYQGRILSIFSWRIKQDKMELRKAKRWHRIFILIWRVFVTGFYVKLMPAMFASFLIHADNSFMSILAQVQVISVSIFSIICFVTQQRSEYEIFDVIQRFIHIYKQISSKTNAKAMLGRTFVMCIILKLILSGLGLIYEIPLIFESGVSGSLLAGVYLWLGRIYMLDCCFVGFLVIRQMYVEMAAHLAQMIDTMRIIDVEQPPHRRLTNHQRMKLLCIHAESIDESSVIYTSLYKVTQRFYHIFRWQISFYIYYNFVIILMQLHQFILRYFHTGYIDLLSLFSSVFKLCNLVLLIMCADAVVAKSQLPDSLDLDLICSDIDERWDVSVETFICQRKVENLEISVLGFFHLNNEFILVIISAIMSYLFVLIQFGMTKNSVTAGHAYPHHTLNHS